MRGYNAANGSKIRDITEKKQYAREKINYNINEANMLATTFIIAKWNRDNSLWSNRERSTIEITLLKNTYN